MFGIFFSLVDQCEVTVEGLAPDIKVGSSVTMFGIFFSLVDQCEVENFVVSVCVPHFMVDQCEVNFQGSETRFPAQLDVSGSKVWEYQLLL